MKNILKEPIVGLQHCLEEIVGWNLLFTGAWKLLNGKLHPFSSFVNNIELALYPFVLGLDFFVLFYKFLHHEY